jgi:hypothetical protein
MDLPALFAGCRTEADFYRVQIAAENLLAPPEVAALAARAAEFPDQVQAWLARLSGLMRRSAPEPEPYRRRTLGEHVNFYEGAGGPGAPRRLVVGFTGVALRMNLPASAFLQALPAAECDVLIIGDAARVAFLAGVRGYAPDLRALAARLAQDVPGFAAYPGGIRCIGTSAGGAAALCFGRIVGARRAVSVDGAHPAALGLRFAQDVDRTALDRAVAGLDTSGTELIAAHGEANPRDTVRGRLLAAGLPGARCLAIRVEAGHGLLAPLLTRRALRRFLAEILLTETPLAEMPEVWVA